MTRPASASASNEDGMVTPSTLAVLSLLGASFTCFRVGSRMAADHYLKVAPRHDAALEFRCFDDGACVLGDIDCSTIMPSDEIAIRAGPFIVKNRPML
jgi:hypothetical protein